MVSHPSPRKKAKNGTPSTRGGGDWIMEILDSHPGDKNKNVARMGHPDFFAFSGLKRETWGTQLSLGGQNWSTRFTLGGQSGGSRLTTAYLTSTAPIVH